MDIVKFSLAGDGFPVGNPRHAGGHPGIVFPEHSFDVNFQVKLSHAGDNGVSGLIIDVDLKCRIFLGEPGQRLGHIGFGFVILGCDGQRDYGFRHIHRCHGQADARSRKCVAGSAVYSEKGADIAGRNFVDVLHLIRVNTHNSTDLDLFARADVNDRVTFGNRPLIHTDVGKLSVGPVFQFKCQRDQRFLFVRIQQHRGFICFHVQGMVLDVGGAG